MLYEFIAEDGTIIEEPHSMKNAPDEIEREGKKYKRVAFSRSNKVFFADAQVATTTHGYPRTDVTLPKGDDVGGGMDPEGRPIIKSQAHERDVMARYNMKRD